jgi:hypothetical protein
MTRLESFQFGFERTHRRKQYAIQLRLNRGRDPFI